MADKAFINDYGSAVWDEGKGWYKTGSSTSQLPDSSINSAGGDMAFVEDSIVYNIADPQGKTTYPAIEEVVAINLYQYITTATDALVEIIASVPVAGVLRCWVEGAGANIDIYVNGIKLYSSGTSQATAYPINVDIGDVVSIVNSTPDSNRNCKALIYPFAYSH